MKLYYVFLLFVISVIYGFVMGRDIKWRWYFYILFMCAFGVALIAVTVPLLTL